MSPIYKAAQGDCISSIAFELNLFPETIWEHPENARLKKERKDPNVLLPGDEVFIPERVSREVECETGQVQRVRRKGVPEKLRIRFLDEMDEPRAGIPYTVEIETTDGQPVPLISKKTTPEGYLDITIPPNAIRGTIQLGDEDQQETIPVALGSLDPLDSISGAQARLNNLGYCCGNEDGSLGELTRSAIREFQIDNDLPELGESATHIDDETLTKIDELYSGAS